MSDADEIEEIRRRKRERLEARIRGEEPESDAASGQGTSAPDEPIHVTGPDHFSELTGKYDVVLVDFYADWCGPCKMVEPVVEDVARETDAAVAKVDIDAQQALAGQFGVRSVPTLAVFADGSLAERVAGARGKAELKSMVERHA